MYTKLRGGVKNKMIQTGVRISEELNDDISALAMGMDLSKNEIIRRAIKAYCIQEDRYLLAGREMKKTRNGVRSE